MNCGKILFWPWENLDQLTEEKSLKKGLTIGLCDTIHEGTIFETKLALMIFIKKSGIMEYEVLVLKSNKNEKYIKLPQDNFTRYEENDEYISFFFYCYFAAHKFADTILPYHKEFHDRPVIPLP